jgi:hypothetical protein
VRSPTSAADLVFVGSDAPLASPAPRIFTALEIHHLRAVARAARAFADTLEDGLDAAPPTITVAAISPTPAPADRPRNDYVTASEYAAHRRVSRTTVFGWIRRGLPSSKQGGTRRISWREADQFLDGGALSEARHKPRRRRTRSERTAA